MPIHFCSLSSGSSGNCQYIASEETRVLLDAGLSGRYIIGALESIGERLDRIEGILVTHEHTDHIRGLGVLYRKIKKPIYATAETWEKLKGKTGDMAPEHRQIIEPGQSFHIGDIEVHPVAVPHDAVSPVAYGFSNEKAKICVATDLGMCPEPLIDTFMDCDLLMLEANHDVDMLLAGPYPYYLKRRILSDQGHLSNETAGKMIAHAVKTGQVRTVLLAHLSKENNVPELAYETVGTIIEEAGIRVGEDIQLDLTYREKVGKLYHIRK